MVAFTGGMAALVLGIIGIVVWWSAFLEILMGVIPLMLVLGGALATYLSIEEMRDKEVVEYYDPIKREFRREIDTIKQEIKKLKDKTPSQP